MLSVGPIERERFPLGAPCASFDDVETAYHAVALAFRPAQPQQHWRAWIHGRRLAWVGTPPNVEAGDATHLAMAQTAGFLLRQTLTRARAGTN